MDARIIVLEEIRAQLDDTSPELAEAKRHLDAVEYWLCEYDRRCFDSGRMF